jgi:hypothetical protein
MTNGVLILAVVALHASIATGFIRPPAATLLGRVLATQTRSSVHVKSEVALASSLLGDDDDDIFADIFKARDARRAAIKVKAADMAAALQLEEELVAADDAEGRQLDGEVGGEDEEDDTEFYNAAELFAILDVNNDGELTKAEVLAGAEKLELTEAEAADLFDEVWFGGLTADAAAPAQDRRVPRQSSSLTF